MGRRTFTLVNFEPFVVVCLNDARAGNKHDFISDTEIFEDGEVKIFYCLPLYTSQLMFVKRPSITK